MKQKNNNNLFVKFVPYNSYTIESIINKTIKFSNVYEFNDINEENIHPIDYSGLKDEKKLKAEIQKWFNNNRNLNNFYNALDSSCNYTKDNKNNLYKFWPREVKYFSDNQILNAVEIISNLETKMFCMSDIKVFVRDEAQIMFAHYGDNFKGLALIYEYHDTQNSTKEMIKYGELPDYKMEDKINKCITLLHGKGYRHYINKSKNWEYENEHRVFTKINSSIVNAQSRGLKLIGIFYIAN